jgi:hypothetical protein
MTEEVTSRKSITQIDNEMLSYVHATRIRHDQLMMSYHRIPPTRRARLFKSREAKTRRSDYLRKAYKAYVQFETMKTLRSQASLVSTYGQAAVNRAVGDYRTQEERQQRMGLVRRMVNAPRVTQAPPKHVLTRKQAVAHRFDRMWRMY